jgi:predicted PurR-regulated permease PerM
MSLYTNKPKLIHPKLLQYYYNKININNKEKIYKNNQENNINQLITQYGGNWYNNLYNNILDFIKKYYGFCIIVFLIVILLIVRYIEVKKKKEKVKHILKILKNKNK